MRTSKIRMIRCPHIFVLGSSIASAQTNAIQTKVLARNVEAQAIGGMAGQAWITSKLGLQRRP
jgi:hypothetical protein